METAPHHREAPTGRRLLALSILALGVVYGDIGTSPLYAMRECFYGSHAVALSRANILGVGEGVDDGGGLDAVRAVAARAGVAVVLRAAPELRPVLRGE